MRLVAILCIVVTVSFSHILSANAGTPSGIINDFQFIQNNRVIQSNSEVVTLSRRAFSIRYRGKGTAPSVYANFNPKLNTQVTELHDPIVSFAGTGSAAYPSQLYVENDALDLYQGWSAAFDKAWGTVQGDTVQTAYATLRNRLTTEPTIIMSGRNYSNFEQQADGSYLFTVNQINDSFPPFTDVTTLHLILFVDDSTSTRDASVYLLNWSPLVITFSGR